MIRVMNNVNRFKTEVMIRVMNNVIRFKIEAMIRVMGNAIQIKQARGKSYSFYHFMIRGRNNVIWVI